jgi:hypothetical protein
VTWWFSTSQIVTYYFVDVDWHHELRIVAWHTPYLLTNCKYKQINKLGFGIYINVSGNYSIQNQYNHGLLFWYYKIEGRNENISIFWLYINSLLENIGLVH